MNKSQKKIHLTPEDAEKAARLLSIIYAKVMDSDAHPNSQPPFVVSKSGVITFCPQIQSQLNLPENQDLLEWAHKNIATLF